MSGGRSPYPAEQRQRGIDLVREGYTWQEAAEALGVTRSAIASWVARYKRDNPGNDLPTARGEGARARRRAALREDIEWMVVQGEETDVTSISKRLLTYPLTPTQVVRFVEAHHPDLYPRLTGINEVWGAARAERSRRAS